MEFETILYEVDDRIATITLNRPEQLNTISPQMTADLVARTRPPSPTTQCGPSSSRARAAPSAPARTLETSKTTSAWCTRSPTSPRIRSGKRRRRAHRRSAP